jgi:serine/threonine protein kinase
LPPSLPEVIGKYTIERFIESGGMGDVYLARDPTLDRLVAIKFLREGFDNQEMRERFEREARAAGRISHPNIVTIYEFGEFDRRPFIAMEFVRGEPLSKLIRRREPIPVVRKLEMMEGLCAGLAYAHKAGIVHRDIKPANLMVDGEGGPLKILDFGIVRMAGSGLTSHGVLVGTVNYMSPEQIAGSSAIDYRSDVFAVGSVLHELFTYQRAFPGEMADVLYKIVHAQPESAAKLAPGLDPGIVRAIDQCLDKSPDRRYQDLGILRRDLARIRQRLELEETDGSHGPTALTMRVTDPASPASRPSGGAQGTPIPGTPVPLAPASSPVSGPPVTPASERARRAAAAAEELTRARRANEDARIALEREAAEHDRLEAERLEEERLEEERFEAERVEHEQLERERLARERDEAERARVAREEAERVEAEQARAQQARAEQARAEQARLEKARAEEAERARIGREQAEQARLAEARQAREKAERERAEAQRRAEAEAKRQADARRQQRQRDLAQAQQDVAAGRVVEAAERLRPWAAESAGDAAFAAVLRQAEAGVAGLDAERRRQETLAKQLASASELVLRQDFAGAGRLVQAILEAHPSHPAAKNLEREIARGVEQRAKAATAVERAHALFAEKPGEALELLERFTPAHGLVDSALAALRERHAARERERLRREQRERRQASIGAVTAQAGALARSRAVQGSVAALLVVIVLIASWSSLFPPTPLDPDAGTATRGTATPGPDTTAGQPAAGGKGATGAVDGPAKPADGDRGTATPSGVDSPKESAKADGGPTNPTGSKDAGAGVVVAPGPTAGPTSDTKSGKAPTDGGSGNAQGSGGIVTPGGTPSPVDPTPPDPGPSTARPETPAEPAGRDTVRVPPPGTDMVEVAEQEIYRWIADYMAAFRALDEPRVKAMNPAARLNARQVKSASVTFSGLEIYAAEDGQTAILKANVQYTYEFKRPAAPPNRPPQAIEWQMRRTPNGSWVARPVTPQ